MSVQHMRLPDGSIMTGEVLEQTHLAGYSGGEDSKEIFCVLQLNAKNFIIEEMEAVSLALRLVECIQACREGVRDSENPKSPIQNPKSGSFSTSAAEVGEVPGGDDF